MTRTEDGLSHAGRVENIEDEPKIVNVGGKQIAVFRIEDEIYAVRNVCPHQYGPVGRGNVDREEKCIYCPWHGWKFDLETGENDIDDKKIRTYDTTVRGDEVYVKL